MPAKTGHQLNKGTRDAQFVFYAGDWWECVLSGKWYLYTGPIVEGGDPAWDLFRSEIRLGGGETRDE
ncbi:hypothetical protein N7527_004768 [Penicillium freii]|nr:hypothetical protein N7527_004768 [Penicillium freii]